MTFDLLTKQPDRGQSCACPHLLFSGGFTRPPGTSTRNHPHDPTTSKPVVPGGYVRFEYSPLRPPSGTGGSVVIRPSGREEAPKNAFNDTETMLALPESNRHEADLDPRRPSGARTSRRTRTTRSVRTARLALYRCRCARP